MDLIKGFALSSKTNYYRVMNIEKTFFFVRYLIFFLFLASSNAFAAMYKQIDEEGNVSYTDTPPYDGASPLDAPGLTFIPPTKVAKKKPEKNQAEVSSQETKVTKYKSLKVESPVNDETIRDNNGNFSVSIAIEPALNVSQGHYLIVLIDGKALPEKMQSTSISLTNIDRGEHKIKAVIRDKKGKKLRQSKTVTVHVKRHSILRKKAR